MPPKAKTRCPLFGLNLCADRAWGVIVYTQIPFRFSASAALPIVFAEFLTHLLAEGRFLLDLCARPDPEFENPLKLLSVVMPSIIVAERMRGKIIIYRVRSTSAVGQDMVRFPIVAVDGSAADVATSACLSQ
jgi:hypothetical protein